MGFPYNHSSEVSSIAPEDSINLSQHPSLRGPRAGMFSKRIKPLDMQGREVDLDNMPADATVIKNDNGPSARFDNNTPADDRARVLLDMQKQAQDAKLQDSNFKIDPMTGMEQKAPLRMYNHDTGEYSMMAASGPKIASDRAKVWADRIRASETTAVNNAKTTAEQARLDREQAAKDARLAEADRQAAKKQEYDIAHGTLLDTETVADRRFTRAQLEAANAITNKKSQLDVTQAELDAVAKLPPSARNAAYEKLGVKVDRAAADRELANEDFAALQYDMNKGRLAPSIMQYSQRLAGIATPEPGFKNTGATIKGLGPTQILNHAGLVALRNDITRSAKIAAASNPNITEAEIRDAMVGLITSQLKPETVPYMAAVIQALGGQPAIAPAAAAIPAADKISSHFMNP